MNLRELLEDQTKRKGNNEVSVYNLGHSFGISDKLILNQVMNHECISKITSLFFEEFEAFFNNKVNLNRILKEGDDSSKKLLPYTKSHRMPQHNDSMLQRKEFKNFVKKKMYVTKLKLGEIIEKTLINH